ncbi:tripartite tricarboxylate transporter substrate-binding protein [Malaciobacter mytili]|uniref:tripartite tricarboxylate transporter substrate-binding protein n=1 Tax=Malaciobacter mytili TaxID=603050 RepID=UPI0013E938AF|nr:tripartite tricarboxylate transporter substrate-binding protein [Malaciobacter mytili]
MKIIFLLFILYNTIFANDYPNKPIELIVGLGEGGSADRMTRNMVLFLEEELGVKLHVKNIKENVSLDAAKYVLNQKDDGYTLFSSAFSPYLLTAILRDDTNFTLKDFEIINLQWFEYDLFLVNKDSKFKTILEILEYIKKHPKNLNVGVMNKSSSHITFKLLLEKFNIPMQNINLKLFSGGRKARESLINSEIDLLVIAGQGSEKYRKKIKPLAVISKKRSKRWDAPTLNEALYETGVTMPIINGSIRGIAVSKKFKEKYPNRYRILKNAIKKVLAKRKVQSSFKNKNIGYLWIGSKNSTKILEDSIKEFKKYNYLIKD